MELSFLETKKIRIGWRARVQQGGRPPLPFLQDWEKWPNITKKDPGCVHLLFKLYIQNVVLRVSRKKNTKKFTCRVFFLCVCFYRSALSVPRNLPCPEKSLVARLLVSAYSTFLVWTFQESICGENKVLTNFQVRKRKFT